MSAPLSVRFAPRYISFLCLFSMLMLLCSLAAPLCFAGSPGRDKGAKDVQNVPDVTNGMRYLLEDDDLTLLQISTTNNQVTTSLQTFDTSNSQISTQPTNIPVSQTDSQGEFNTNGIPAAEASGRMYDTISDIIAVLNEGNGPTWQLTLIDPLSQFTHQTTLTSSFHPYGTTYTQVAMGNFAGTNLDGALVLYTSLASDSHVEWGMKVLTAANPQIEAAPKEGPEFYGNVGPTPVTGSVVTGDFNGDGRDEIALLLTDYQTIVFYAVDPQTLTISEITRYTLRDPFVSGQATLAAGKFRDTINAELVAYGQIKNQSAGYSVVSIQVTPGMNGGVMVQDGPIYKYGDKHHSTGALAQAASILNWPQQNMQQVVLGTRVDGLGDYSYIDIGSFDSGLNYTPQSETHLKTSGSQGTELLQMRVGNFDNKCGAQDQCPIGKHNPALQIETLTSELGVVGASTVARIWSIYPPNPILHVTDWLQPRGSSDLQFGGGPTLLDLLPGDFQGRSLRLGSPEVVRVPLAIQPDIVLGIPPMHIDWINPVVTTLQPSQHPGCNNPPQPCLLNLTVLPSLPAPGVGFSTGFDFSSSSDSQSQRTSTTSWGVSVKETSETSIGWGDALSGGSASIENSTMYAHNHNVSQTYNHYQGQTDSLSATTGFADHIFFTEKAMNIYYYPVLATKSCPSNDPQGCTDDEKKPTYVEFSVPDQITHADLDGTSLEWYQPVHEPGNALSYPWSLTLLKGQFTNVANPLTEMPAPCQGTDTSMVTYTTTWTAGHGQSQTSGTTNSFSDDLSVSFTDRAGVQDVASGSFEFGFDFGVSTSVSTLNVNTSSLSTSTGIAVNKPQFDSDTAQCCLYDFAAYIFGQSNTKNPAYQSITVKDPHGMPVQISNTGPLFTGFLSDVVPDASGLNCGGAPSWWLQAYNLPDVAVNHPARWQWSKSTQTASFNMADQSGKTSPLDQSFYQMKGFFVTKPGEETSSPSLASATAGDDLELTARVYNYSLIDTNSPSLTHPAKAINVRFYGQFYCSSGDGSENSCVNGHDVCDRGTLCGNAFEIGQKELDYIPGFKSPNFQENAPNWEQTSIDFNTANYPNQLANSYLVFWVVVWMEDNNGNLVSEIPDHGLTMDPQQLNLAQITDVPIEQYSNNVGMYGVNAPLFIYPTQPGSSGSGGLLQSISLSSDQRILLEDRTKMTTELRATGGPLNNVTIGYYEGDPARNGRLLDLQRIAHMDPGITYRHRAFYTPDSCGIHNLYAWAWAPSTPGLTAKFSTAVVIEAPDQVQALINSTAGTEFAQPVLRAQLLDLLNTALQDFQQNQAAAGSAVLRTYISTVNVALGKGVSRDRGSRLIGQADVILQCVPRASVSPSPNGG